MFVMDNIKIYTLMGYMKLEVRNWNAFAVVTDTM